jgi:hypothetical protein
MATADLVESPDVLSSQILALASASLEVTESGDDTLAGVLVHTFFASLTAQESSSDVLASVAKNHASASLTAQESSSDVLASVAKNHASASLTAQESSSDVLASVAKNHASASLYVKESPADSFAGLSTHALYVYVNLVETQDTFASAGVVPHFCSMAAVEAANDRFFCYTSGIFPLNAPRGFSITLPRRSYNAKVV